MIKAVIFDLDNTLVDFMLMKRQAIDAAINAMRDAGLKLSNDEIRRGIDEIYEERGMEFQKVFDELMYREFSKIDTRFFRLVLLPTDAQEKRRSFRIRMSQ